MTKANKTGINKNKKHSYKQKPNRHKVETNIYYDTAKKLYYVNLDYGKDENGKRIKPNVTTKTKKEAQQILREFQANKTKGTLVKPKEDKLSDWLKYWINDICKNNRAETTVYGYENIIKNHINPVLGNIKLQNLTPIQIQQYYSKLINRAENPLSENTVRKHHDLLKTALGVAVKQDILLRNPCDKVEAPKKTKPEQNFYTAEQVKGLKELLENHRLKTAIYLLAQFGLRRGELCGLRWENIDFEKKAIYIVETRTTAGQNEIIKEPKNRTSFRTLLLVDVIIPILQEEYARQQENRKKYGKDYIETDYVIVMENGKPYRPNYLSELFTKFIEETHLPKLTLHGLRHTVASILFEENLQTKKVSDYLGHSNVGTTNEIYAHFTRKTHEDTANLLASKI